MVKKLIKGCLFVGIFVGLLYVTSLVFVPKNNDKESGMLQPTAYGILAEKNDSIDTLFIGDSESYSSIIPMELWKNYGFTSYVCGSPKQKLSQSYDFLEKALQNQKLKVVVLETNAIFRRTSPIDELSVMLNNLFPIFQYHDRWKTLSCDDLSTTVEYKWTHNLKGYRFNDKVKSSYVKQHMKKNDKQKPISKMNLLMLEKMKKLCDENGIQFVLMSTPSTKNWNYSKHNTIEQYAQKHHVSYVDLNLLEDDIGIDWTQDTRDQGDHLNHKGAMKVTQYMGQYLKNTGLLSNHRDDHYYDDWNVWLSQYEEMVHKKNVSK